MVAGMDTGNVASTDSGPAESGVGFGPLGTETADLEATPPDDAVRALLIIDDAGRLGDVADLLTASGMQVDRVSDPYGADGIARPGHPFSVIVLDVLLPTRDLYRLCRRLRASGRVPLVIASWEERVDLDAGARDRIVPHSSSAAELARGVLAAVTGQRQPVRITD